MAASSSLYPLPSASLYLCRSLGAPLTLGFPVSGQQMSEAAPAVLGLTVQLLAVPGLTAELLNMSHGSCLVKVKYFKANYLIMHMDPGHPERLGQGPFCLPKASAFGERQD